MPQSRWQRRPNDIAVNKITCPFRHCTQHSAADKPTGFENPSIPRQHLLHVHKDSLYQLTDEQLHKDGLLTCRHCESFVCETHQEQKFKTHLKSHTLKRNTTNFDIVTSLLYNDVQDIHRNHWEEGLKFLKIFKFAQPKFRTTLVSKISYRLEENVLKTYQNVLECCIEANKENTSSKYPNDPDYDPNPVWILPFVFERLILGPNPNPKDESINQLVHRRLRLFKAGKIQELYNLSNQIESRSPQEQASTPVQVSKAAQVACDNNNFKSGNARLTNNLPVAVIDDDNIDILRNLNPPSLNLNLSQRERTTRGSI